MNTPPEMRARRQWLVWKFEAHEEQGKKPRKMPYYVDGGRRVGKQGDEKDRARLASFDEALKASPPKGKGGIGFAFLPGDGLAGIDLDGALEFGAADGAGEISRTPTERTRAIVEACRSFTEYSPSGKGLHIFVTTAAVGPFKSFKNNSIGVEVFCGAQFFTFSGDMYPGSALELAPIDEVTLRRLRATVRAAKPAASGKPSNVLPIDDEQRRAEAALVYVAADDYQRWIDIGMALKHGFGDSGYAIWDRWSARSGKYPGGEETRRRWGTFNPSGALKLGTVFELAKQSGWVAPRPPKKSRQTETAGARLHGADSSAPPPADPPASSGGGPADGIPKIRWIQGKLPECIDQAEGALIKAGAQIYQRAGMLVRVVKRDTPSVRHYKRPPGSLGVVPIDTPYLIESMTRAAYWEKFSSQKDAWIRTNAPEQAAVTLLARRGHWMVPKLWSVISSPTLRPDGTVLQEPGYDAATHTWYDPCGVEFPKIPESPTLEDAQAALEKLSKAFGSFPFENAKADKAVALSLVLSAILRRSLPAAPLGVITAPVMASGKTLLADCISILATGASSPAMKYADTDEEFTKTMLAVLAEGDQVVMIDNVERPLQSDTLCVILTSETFRQRMLGRTEMMTVPTTTQFLATGNHIVLAGDLRTRALLCRIDPKVERPEERQFTTELRSWMIERRPELVAAALTIVRAFISTGQDPKDFCPQWGRFERWSDMVRAPLIWLGEADPCSTLKDLERDDPDRIELARVMLTWEDAFRKDERPGRSAREAIDRAIKAKNDPPSVDPEGNALDLVLREICRERDGAFSAKRLSYWLRKHLDRIVDGKRFVRAGASDHTLLYKVEAVNKS